MTTLTADQKTSLINAASNAMINAYAPYSKFHVGAAILADDGNIYTGCNVENAAYPIGSCAEASAISAMVMAGQSKICLLYTSPSPRDATLSRMPSSA